MTKLRLRETHSALLLSFIFGRVNREITRDRGFRRLSKGFFFSLFVFFFSFFSPSNSPGLGMKLRRAPFEESAPKGSLHYSQLHACNPKCIWTIISSRYLKNILTTNRRNTVHQFILIFFFYSFFFFFNSTPAIFSESWKIVSRVYDSDDTVRVKIYNATRYKLGYGGCTKLQIYLVAEAGQYLSVKSVKRY